MTSEGSPDITKSELASITIVLLSATSPFFDALWPTIMQVADGRTQRALSKTCRYFQTLYKQELAFKYSINAKLNYLAIHRRAAEQKAGAGRSMTQSEEPMAKSVPYVLKLDPKDSSVLWYEWGARICGFDSYELFQEFCEIADVDPDQECIAEFHRGHPESAFGEPSGLHFVSETGDITFTCYSDPRKTGNTSVFVNEFGCTGVRDKAIRLQAWFKEKGYWAELSMGARSYI
ncbi:hypothetical protein M422DRAFT_23296 [Sphaerobolus stellatus SS14]|nr:hypothetical protein M422DRAFT_23296 [Sphaerobolus stellatus SS14]